MSQKDQNFEIWVTLEVTQETLGLPKKSILRLLGLLLNQRGFKLDMLGSEHEIDQKVNGIDQIVNGIDQIVSDHFLG